MLLSKGVAGAAAGLVASVTRAAKVSKKSITQKGNRFVVVFLLLRHNIE
jgi:hypothetical protein